MYVELPGAGTVYMTVEEFLGLTRQEEQYLISINYGKQINNPFHGRFSNRKNDKKDPETEEVKEENLEDLTEEDFIVNDFLDIPDENLDF